MGWGLQIQRLRHHCPVTQDTTPKTLADLTFADLTPEKRVPDSWLYRTSGYSRMDDFRERDDEELDAMEIEEVRR